MAEKMLELGEGLEIWKCNVNEIREQDVNARVMNKKMFDRLTSNIKKDGRLESLPFCALTDSGIEIVSGHHRTRAARAAGIDDIFIILDVTGMSRDKIMSKQLSHNSLQGEDNEQLVREIYSQIKDAEEKIAAFIDAEMELKLSKAKTDDIVFDLNYKSILVTFLPYEKEMFDKATEKIQGEYDEVYVAELEKLEPFEKALKRVGKEYEIRAMGTTFEKMAEITLEHMGEEVEDDEKVAIRDLFGSAYVPKETAELIKPILEKMKKDGVYASKSDKWKALEVMAKAYKEV